MGKTIRHNKRGNAYQDKDSAGVNYHTNIKAGRGWTETKWKNSLYGKYGKRCTLFSNGYANERDARSDRMKGYKHVEGKLLRRELQREAEQIINEEII